MTTTQAINLTTVERDPAFLASLTPAGRLLLRCIRCGTCSASCPAVAAMDLTPRRMWRMAQLGLVDQVLASKTIWLCSLCYQCHVRCPRGIPLTETITRLKELAMERGVAHSRDSVGFYRTFASVIRHYGRTRELEFMVRYFIVTNPLKSLWYARMGALMLLRGKIHLQAPRLTGGDRLGRLFARVAELEAEQ